MTTQLNLDGAKVSIAPAGADPLDTSAWSDLGFTTNTVLDAPAEPRDVLADVLRAKEVVLETAHQFKDPDLTGAFPWLAGIDVIESDHAPRDGALLMDVVGDGGMGMRLFAPRAEFRPFTDLEREGEWAKRAVRHGMADVLAWLGEDAGPAPDDAYTDRGLFKVNLLAAIAGGVL